MKGALLIATFALLLAWFAFTLVRASAASVQNDGLDLVGYVLAFLSVILLIVAAVRAAT